jgi:hypothetical protein
MSTLGFSSQIQVHIGFGEGVSRWEIKPRIGHHAESMWKAERPARCHFTGPQRAMPSLYCSGMTDCSEMAFSYATGKFSFVVPWEADSHFECVCGHLEGREIIPMLTSPIAMESGLFERSTSPLQRT